MADRAANAFEVRAIVRHIPMSTQKVRLVVNAVRGMDASKALDTLRFMPQAAAQPVFKLFLRPLPMPKSTTGWKWMSWSSARFWPTKARAIAKRPTDRKSVV